MPATASIVTFAAAAFVLVIVPGPSVLFIVSRGVALGRRAAVLTVVGNSTGAAVQIVAVAFGLGAILARSAALFTTVKFVGAAYLVWMGVTTIRSRRDLASFADITGTVRTPRSLVLDGFVVGVANPKLAVFLAAILPQFVDQGAAPVWSQLVVLGLVFVLIATVCDGTYALVSGTARRWLAGRPQRLERVGVASGITLVGLGVALAASSAE